MVVLNRLITLGGAGYGLVGQSQLSVGGKKEKIHFGYGGPGFGFKLFADEIVHIDVFNLFGFGGLKFRDSNIKGSVFIIEPELNAEINVTRFLQIGAGASYRFTFASDELAIRSTDLFGFGGQLYFNFGWM